MTGRSLPLLLFLACRIWMAVGGEHGFSCDDGTEIETTKLCDGRPHCPDSSDETLRQCESVACRGERSFKCSYGGCVSAEARCDGLQDCADASDELACDSPRECSSDQFRCANSSECLSFGLLCDGVADCADGSDEAGSCRTNVCPEGRFRCNYGGCVAEEVACDGLQDCADGSDESAELCRRRHCKDGQFGCANGQQCVPRQRLCDGSSQCRDGSDESPDKCPASCGPGQFRCAYGACVAARLRCDGRAHCQDRSDEDDCPPSAGRAGCRLPGARAGLLYRVLGGEGAGWRPGRAVPDGTRLEYACSRADASLGGAQRLRRECRAGRWLPAGLPDCPPDAVKCWGLRPAEGLERRCLSAERGWTSCSAAVGVGTRAVLRCRRRYRRASGSSRLSCLRDATWSQPALSCQPVCGLRPALSQPSVPLIVNGWEVAKEEPLPWHAILFSHEQSSWRFFCGGTLLTTRLVLTAAHCVWESEASSVRVVLGARSSNFSDLAPSAQVLSLRAIEIQTSYQDHEGNYNSDLALLVLSRAARLAADVMPACVDWSDELDISDRSGQVGIVAGMGATESGSYSTSLRVVSARVYNAEFAQVSAEMCRENEAPEFRKYLAYTSFCAGWANGTGVCNGDSGGGFLLQRPESDIWEIYGIVSLSPRRKGTSSLCDLNYYTVFTKLSAYLGWIKKIMKSNSLGNDEDSSDELDVTPNRDHLQLD